VKHINFEISTKYKQIIKIDKITRILMKLELARCNLLT